MIERSDRIDLAPSEARCHRDDCGHATSCARRLASIPAGSPLMDCMAQSQSAVLGWCTEYLSAKFRRKDLMHPRGEVKPFIRGLA